MWLAKLKAEGIEKSSLSARRVPASCLGLEKEKYGGVISATAAPSWAPLRGWERTCFTTDEARTESVPRVFCGLYEKGPTYRGVRMVNWDPSAQTALSDEEVVFKESHGKLYYLRYRVEGTDCTIHRRHDPARAHPRRYGPLRVNPDDERYAWLPEDARVIVPLVGRSGARDPRYVRGHRFRHGCPEGYSGARRERLCAR
ncbi:MAG: class I tRNA ligase family protein [Alistipes putredinis]